MGDIVTLKVIVIENDQSKGAMEVSVNGKRAWIPRSLIEKLHITGDRADLTIPAWLYNKEFE